MKTHSINKFEELHRIIEGRYLDEASTIYRGVADAEEHKLTPGVGRDKCEYDLETEKEMLSLFKRHAYPFLGDYEPADDYEWLALAQHHGLPTRLLDWTYNPLVALFFSVEQEIDVDAAVYVSSAPEIINLDDEDTPGPFELDEVMRLQTVHFASRISAQSGLFTIHPNPTEEFHEKSLERIIVPAKVRDKFKDILDNYGVNAGTLFPDLDGQARYIKWFYGF